jgi:LPXTG-site transpeptidase (sortase) family protein
MQQVSGALPLTELDVKMFLQPAPRRESPWRSLILSAVGFVTLTGIVFGLLNLPAWIQIDNTPTLTPVVAAAPTATPAVAPQPAVGAIVATPQPLDIPDNTISIPSLGISAPISWGVSLDPTADHNALENGVMSIDGTARPGQQGVTVISGHSSNYIWDKGQYNTVFAPLEKAYAGMPISIAYNGQEYHYVVTRTYVVKPNDLSVLSDESLTGIRLLTCTPVGTALNRLVVEAKQVTPDPGGAMPFTPAQFSGALPKSN